MRPLYDTHPGNLAIVSHMSSLRFLFVTELSLICRQTKNVRIIPLILCIIFSKLKINHFKNQSNGGFMKKTLLLFFLAVISTQLFAVSNLKVNGTASTAVTALPADVVMTCDLAAKGNDVDMEVWLDSNGSKTIDAGDILTDFMVITDGIGWIRDPDNSTNDIPGDETSADSKLKVTEHFTKETNAFFVGTMILKLKDKDGSSATAIINFNIELLAPIIKGQVTAKEGGTQLEGIIITASLNAGTGSSDIVFALTDKKGNYQIGVSPGTWKVIAEDFNKREYMPSDTAVVPISAGQTITKDFQMEKYKSFIEGYTKKQDGTPVPGILILLNGVDVKWGANVTTNDQGYYKTGVVPGKIGIGISSLFQTAGVWPDGFYADPEADTVNVASGATAQANFTFKPYSCFIQGTCTAAGQGLGDVQITGMAFEGTGLKYYSTTSKADGTYKLGVSPGTVMMLNAVKDGYQVTNPSTGYFNIAVLAGQTVSGKDFTLTAAGVQNYIAGTVTFDNSSAADNVYVVAIDAVIQNRTGYLIQYSNSQGAFRFNDVATGSWKVGVYKSGYVSAPYHIFGYVSAAAAMENTDFVLSKGTGVEDAADQLIPNNFNLEQNYPNPFKPGAMTAMTTIRFYLDKNIPTDMSIYNLTGQLVRRINQGSLQAGVHQFDWDGRDDIGNLVPSGVYFYHLQAGDKSLNKRMVVIR
jgi:hypothetical protein